MLKTSKKNNKPEMVMTLYEKVDIEILEKLICAEGLEENLRNQLKLYYNKRKNNVISVKYHYSKNLLDKGRLYAQGSLSLQNFKKEIRHNLAGKYYYDIDMENCHPRLILQYCKKHNIDHDNLEKYVTEREDILKKICKFHKIERDDAKKLVLRLCYLGNYIIEKFNDETQEYEESEPQIKLDFLTDFQTEFKNIATSICGIEKETYELVKKNDCKKNKKSATLSITAQILEHKCLMGMYDYFTKQGHKVGVLCFDGLMIEKSKNLDKKLKEVLKACEAYVKQKTKYEISLSEKKMDTPLTYVLPDYSDYVESDLDCQKKLFKIEGAEKFKYCKGNLYIFNEKTGMYETSIETLFYYLIKNKNYLNIITKQATEHSPEKVESYGESSQLQNRVIQFVKTAAKDPEWLEKTENTSLGYLLFKDGIYNMKTGEFKKGFNPKIVFHTRVPWKFPQYDKKEIKKARKLSFDKIFENPDTMIAALACALAGDIKIKKFYFCPGRPNAGKSKLAQMLQIAFGGYVGNFNAESLAYTSAMDTKDEAAKMRWALLVRFCRILLSNEINMKKKLNANDIKKHSSGGDKLTGRTHQKEEVHFTPHYTPFCMLNDIPQIEPMDDATMKRLTYIEFPYVFVDEDEVDKKAYFKKKDDDLDDKIQDNKFIRGFIHILLDGYKDFLENGMPEFDQEVKNKWTIDNKQNTEIIDVIKENFEITQDKEDKVNIRDLKKFRENHKDVFSTISTQRFNEILKDELKLEEGRDSSSRFWKGIKKISKNDINF
jgi:phage/plasmid-associated DNA primase